MVQSQGRCIKTPFVTAALARQRIKEIRILGEMVGVMRPYWCDDCRNFHLTTSGTKTKEDELLHERRREAGYWQHKLKPKKLRRRRYET